MSSTLSSPSSPSVAKRTIRTRSSTGTLGVQSTFMKIRSSPRKSSPVRITASPPHNFSSPTKTEPSSIPARLEFKPQLQFENEQQGQISQLLSLYQQQQVEILQQKAEILALRHELEVRDENMVALTFQ